MKLQRHVIMQSAHLVLTLQCLANIKLFLVLNWQSGAPQARSSACCLCFPCMCCSSWAWLASITWHLGQDWGLLGAWGCAAEECW